MNNNLTSIPEKNIPLVVDLDGTIIKTDLLFETANKFITDNPFKLLFIIKWLISGKAYLKGRLGKAISIDPSSLPYNSNVVMWLEQQRLSGRKIVLATASDRNLAESVAKYLGLFDEVLASDKGVNLKSDMKKNVLIEKFGIHGFDYVGNEYADIPIWEFANKVYAVSSSKALIKRVLVINKDAIIFTNNKPVIIESILHAVRPHQWLKNALIFVPLLAAQQYNDSLSFIHAILAFIVFGLTASSAYVLNDLIDLENDRHHLRKKLRPLASGTLSILSGWMLWPILLMIAFLISIYSLPLIFVAVQVSYLFLTLFYSFYLKKIPIVDVLTLATLYTLRIIAGTVATSLPLSFWLLTFSMFIFLSLAFTKRFSEIKLTKKIGKSKQIRGRGYRNEDLEIVSSMGVSSGFLSVLVLALYIQDPHTANLYKTPEFIWMACPLLLFWIARVWLIAHRGSMHDDPVFFAIKDYLSWVLIALFGLIFISAIFF